MNYESTRRVQSAVRPGVSFTVRRISFERRLELMRKVRNLGLRLEFARAGEAIEDRLDAAVTNGEIDRLYLEWGLQAIDGLDIDGRSATPALLSEIGPEDLCQEVVNEVRKECGLTEEERKN
jgi:hypothetical protein